MIDALDCGFTMTGSRAGFAAVEGLPFAPARGDTVPRAAARDLVFADLVDFARTAALLGLRAAGFAAFRAFDALRAVALMRGFLDLGAFLAGINFSVPVQSSAGL